MRAISCRAGLALAAACGVARSGAGQGDARPDKPLPPLANPADPRLPAKEVFGRALTPDRGQGALDRLLLARLPRRRQGAAGRRRVLAGGAPVAQPHVGQSGDDRLPRALLAQGQGRGRLERHSGRRHLPAARRPDADRPRLASGRPRRRRLADADARPYAEPRGARGHVGGQHGDRGRALGRPVALVGGAGARSSRRRPRSPRSSASSSTRRSRRRCARPTRASPG